MVLHERATAMRIVLYTDARKINRVAIVHWSVITSLVLPVIYSIQSFQLVCKPGHSILNLRLNK